METYKFAELDNGDILLQKITNVNITHIKDIKDNDFKKSFITEC
jgi:hypothetical protein